MLTDAHKYSPRTGAWTSLGDVQPEGWAAPRCVMAGTVAAVQWRGRRGVLVFGGADGKRFCQLEALGAEGTAEAAAEQVRPCGCGRRWWLRRHTPSQIKTSGASTLSPLPQKSPLPPPLLLSPSPSHPSHLIASHILCQARIQDVHDGFSRDVLLFDAASNRWSAVALFPESTRRATAPGAAAGTTVPIGGHVTTTAVTWGDSLVIASGECSPGIRTPNVWKVGVRPDGSGPQGSFGPAVPRKLRGAGGTLPLRVLWVHGKHPQPSTPSATVRLLQRLCGRSNVAVVDLSEQQEEPNVPQAVRRGMQLLRRQILSFRPHVIVGPSFGAAVLTWLLAEGGDRVAPSHRLPAVVLIAPSHQQLLQQQQQTAGRLPADTPLLSNPADAATLVRSTLAAKGRRILVLQGGSDDTVDAAAVSGLAAAWSAAGADVRLQVFEGRGHDLLQGLHVLPATGGGGRAGRAGEQEGLMREWLQWVVEAQRAEGEGAEGDVDGDGVAVGAQDGLCAAPSVAQLYYLDLRVRGEAIRLALLLGNVPFHDVRCGCPLPPAPVTSLHVAFCATSFACSSTCSPSLSFACHVPHRLPG